MSTSSKRTGRGPLMSRACDLADLLADVEHRRFVALALADDDRAVDRHGVHDPAHGFDRDLIGLVAVALAHRVRARDRGLFDDAEKFKREIGMHGQWSVK